MEHVNLVDSARRKNHDTYLELVGMGVTGLDEKDEGGTASYEDGKPE